MKDSTRLKPRHTLIGLHFGEPMRIVTLKATGSGRYALGLVGTQTKRFRSVTLSESDLAPLGVREAGGEYGDRQ